MKRIFQILILVSTALCAQAQVPGGINYQVVLRSTGGEVLANEAVSIAATITDAEGNLYNESISATSDAFGVVNVIIGTIDTTGELNELDWGAGNVSLSVNVSSSGGSIDMGTSQLLSVPFAFYAANAGSSKVGPQGEQGPAGEQGVAGPVGPQGPIGPQGEAGQDGTGVNIVGTLPSPNDLPAVYNGSVGDMYIIEENGAGYIWNGTIWVSAGQIQGPAGATGPQGSQGPIGPQGPAGQDGAQGPMGLQGLAGADGQQGPQGEVGPQGEQGDQGPQGLAGPQGDTGPQGPAGPTGPQGEQGDQGPQGEQGPAGTYTAGTGIALTAGQISNTGDTNPTDDITTSTDAGGDLAGTYPAPTVNRIKGIGIIGTPSEGSVLKYASQSGQFEYSPDFDSNPWLGVPGGVSYNGITVSSDEIAFAGTNYGSIRGTSGSTYLQWNGVGRVGYFNSNTEFGPNFSNLINLGSSDFRWREVWSTNGVNQSSDRRLKKEITPLAYGLAAVMNMEPVSYKWKKGNKDTQLGFIAQEMEEVVPEVVTHTPGTAAQKSTAVEDGRVPGEDMYAMNYSKLIPVLVKAIQEQQEQIDLLKEEIRKLKD